MSLPNKIEDQNTISPKSLFNQEYVGK
jgi:hypothetical protein